MEPSSVRLVSLFLALFDKSGELYRFARHTFGNDVTLGLESVKAVTELAERISDQLGRYGLVDHRLFDALLASRPDRADVINGVRDELLGESGAVRAQDPSPRPAEATHTRGTRGDVGIGRYAGAEGADRIAWQARVADLLADVPLESAQPTDGWLEAAAVLDGFDPFELRPLSRETDTPPDLLERLVAVSDLRPDGRLSLRLRPRQEALARLLEDDRAVGALDANPDPSSAHRRVLRRALEEGWVPAAELEGLDELRAAHEIGEWLALSPLRPFDRNEIASLLDRVLRMAPMRRLIGGHFRGRVEALASLRRHVQNSADTSRLMSLWGIGGVGKSTLLGKLVLELEDDHVPWVYLDFDHPEADPLQPRRLVELILRQLQQFPTSAELGTDLLALESATSGDTLAFTHEIGNEAGVEEILVALDEGLRRAKPTPSLAVFFDTFEQVQVRGPRAVELVHQLIDTLCRVLPYAQVVVSGRARVDWEVIGGAPVEELNLEDLDAESADQVLVALGVQDEALRRMVVERVGTSPLSLRLAAEALRSGTLSGDTMEELILHVAELERHGQLYTRFLLAIRDGEVRRLAHPGLVVRRVTADLIRVVLADLCELEPQRADAIFARLPHHVSMFEPDDSAPHEGAALRHRQDVREKMLVLMRDDPVWRPRLPVIHRLTVDYYRQRDDAIARAEEIYHHLMLDDHPADFEKRWGPELAPSLSRSWGEPLPARARAWLGPRIGQAHGDDDAWRTEDWEVAAEREARDRLDTADAAGALEVLRRRTSRTSGSPLYRLEAQALMALGRWDEAAAVCEDGLASTTAAGKSRAILQLLMAAAEIALQRHARGEFENYLKRALAMSSRTGDSLAHLRALELLLRDAQDERDPARVRQIHGDIEQVLLRTEEARLRDDPELVQRLAAGLQPPSAAVLRKIAVTFGNRSKQDVIRRDAFALGDLLRKVQATDAGKAQLSELARGVGLSADGYRIADLATQSIRMNKLGDALATVLDNAGQDERMRFDAADLIRGTGQPS